MEPWLWIGSHAITKGIKGMWTARTGLHMSVGNLLHTLLQEPFTTIILVGKVSLTPREIHTHMLGFIEWDTQNI